MTTETLLADLRRDEGVRAKPYRDSVGKLTIGVGRNLDDVGLRPDEIDYLLANDVKAAADQLDARLPWWRKLDDVRQDVLVNMAFNLGIDKLLTFHTTLGDIQRGDYQAASVAMLESEWAKQVHDRATRLAAMMATGQR